MIDRIENQVVSFFIEKHVWLLDFPWFIAKGEVFITTPLIELSGKVNHKIQSKDQTRLIVAPFYDYSIKKFLILNNQKEVK